MKLSQKKTCNRCRAFWPSQYKSNCDLGYKLKDYYTPAEPCLKPLTDSEMADAVINKGDYK